MPFVGTQPREHFMREVAKRRSVKNDVSAVEDFDKTRHVGSLDFCTECNCHADLRHGGLNAAIGHAQTDRIPQSCDTDTIDGLIAKINQRLDVGQRQAVWGVHAGSLDN